MQDLRVVILFCGDGIHECTVRLGFGTTLNLTAMQGLGNVTLFCGDGINDLAALSAANVGMAIGTTDAIVAASLSTRQGSVAGKGLQEP